MDIVLFVVGCIIYVAAVSFCAYKCRNKHFDNNDYDEV